MEKDKNDSARTGILSGLRLMAGNQDLMILSFAVLVSMLGFGLIMPFLPVYAEDFGATDLEIGAIMGCFAIFRLITSPFGGWLSDRVGRKPLIVAGMFFYFFVMFMFGLATSIPELYLWRGLQGAASGLVWPVAMTYVGDVVDEKDRGKAMAMFSLMFATGMAVGPALGGAISTLYSFQTAFFFTSGLALLSAVLMLWKLRESFTKEEREEKLAGVTDVKLSDFRLSNISTQPRVFMAVTLASFTVFFGIAMIYPILPIFAAGELGLNDIEIGILFTVMGLVQVFVMFPAGVVADNMGKKWILVAGAVISGLFAGLVSLSWGFWSLLIFVAMFTVGRSMARPILPAIVSTLAPIEKRGIAMGIYTLAQNLAFALGSVAAGWIAMELGRAWPFTITMLVAVAGGVIVVLGVKEGEE